jgi:hypothetical protein
MTALVWQIDGWDSTTQIFSASLPYGQMSERSGRRKGTAGTASGGDQALAPVGAIRGAEIGSREG